MSGLRIDSDVHCAVPAVSALTPYLDAHWTDFFAMTSFREPPGIGLTYPRWLPMLRTVGEEITVDRIRAEVLSRSRPAIINCYYALEAFTHPYLGPAVATAVNRWLADEWLDPEPNLAANAVITPQHVDAAVEEIGRIADDRRFVGVMVPSRSPVGYGNQRYWPIHEAIAEQGLVLSINVGGSPGSPPTPINWVPSFYEDHLLSPLAFQAQIMSLIFSGIFERCPSLRVVMMESGWTWVPSLMWRMDQEWKAFRREVPWVHDPPSSYLRRHFRFTTTPTDAPPDPRQLAEVLEQAGSAELLLFSSDFPHSQGPGAAPLYDLLTTDQVRQIEYDNALSWFSRLSRLAAEARR